MKSFQQLKNELDEGKLQNFYIFTGEEKEVLRKYIKRIDEKAIRVDSLESLWKQAYSKGLFNMNDRTYVLHNNKEIMELEPKEIIKAVGSHTLILVYDSIDKRAKFFKKADAFITDFEKYTTGQLAGLVQKEFPKMSKQLAFIVAACSNNEVSRLELEMDKLRNVPEEDITIELLEDIMIMPLEDKIFDMIDAVAKYESEKAFEMYYDLIELKESPIKIISLLYSKFRQIFLVQSYAHLSNAEIVEKTGLSFYQVMHSRDSIGFFTPKRLMHNLKQIQETEVKMKTGQVDIALGMDVLLIDILN